LPSSTVPRPIGLPDTRPLPPTRPARQPQRSPYSTGIGGGLSSYGGLGGFGSGYGSGFGGGYGGFGGMGGLSGLGGYSPYGSSIYGGYGMNRMGNNDDYGGGGGFAQQAELSSRHAFQSIESVVQVFGSIAMMLESTFQAVYNSFRAVVGVADHFSRMKANLARIFSALAVMRTLRWLVRKLLTLLRLRSPGADEELWAQAAEASASLAGVEGLLGDDKPRSSWPVMVFFAMVIGGPWLIWKFLNSLSGGVGAKAWASGETDHFVATAEFDFQGESNDELSFRRGTEIIVAPKELQPRMRGWVLASIDGKTTGIVPLNYIKFLGRRPGRRSTQPSVPPLQQPTSQNNLPTFESAFSGPSGSGDGAVPSFETDNIEGF